MTLHDAHRVGQPLRTHRIADPPPRHGVRLRHAVDGDEAAVVDVLAGKLVGVRPALPIEDELVIDVVGDEPDALALAELHQLGDDPAQVLDRLNAEAAAASADREWTQDELMAKGQQVYATNCAACHQPNGQGLPPAFPAIAGSAIATGDPAA